MRDIIRIINPFRFLNDVRKLSFDEGVVKSFKRYRRKDDDYWNSPNNKAGLKYRLVMLFCLIIIVNCFYLIEHQITFKKQFTAGYSQITTGFKEMSKDFPIRIYAYAHYWYSIKNDFTLDEFTRCISDRNFLSKISQIIILDKYNGLAELGGMVFFDNQSLRFVEVQSDFLEPAKEIEAAKGNQELQLSLYQKYRDKIEKRFGKDIAIKAITRWIKRDPESVDAKIRYINFAEFLSLLSYSIDQDSMMRQFYGDFRGYYIGNFHVHRRGEEVSKEDLEASMIEDKFVIISLGNNSFKIAWLKDGKIRHLSEKILY